MRTKATEQILHNPAESTARRTRMCAALDLENGRAVERPEQPAAAHSRRFRNLTGHRALPLAAAVTLLFASLSLPASAPIEKKSQPTPPGSSDSAEYVNCPVDVGKVDENSASLGVACSESLMDPHEVSDIFGKRIANTYLVVEVKVRNLSDSYDYLLHDIRLGYGSLAVTSRDEKLVRGVAEKGQLLDARNVFIRGVESLGAVGGSLSTFSFATVALKNALNVFQGPFTSALKSFLPDFTVNQMSRRDDAGFTVQAKVIPKQSSVSFATFLSRRVFLSQQERKDTRLSLMHRKSRTEGTTLLNIQKNLAVEVAGAHVAEVSTNQPLASKGAPASASAAGGNATIGSESGSR